jgi:nitroreductase
MDLMPEIQKRVSVREFTDEKLSKSRLLQILEAGRLAPSAKNRQPWRFIVIQDYDKRCAIEKACYGQEHVRKAAAVIACCSTNVDYKMPNGQLSYPIDISIAASFMMLQAVRDGLGTCIVTTFDEQQIKDIITAPYLMQVVLLLLVGHPVAEATEPEIRFPLARISSFDHW